MGFDTKSQISNGDVKRWHVKAAAGYIFTPNSQDGKEEIRTQNQLNTINMGISSMLSKTQRKALRITHKILGSTLNRKTAIELEEQ